MSIDGVLRHVRANDALETGIFQHVAGTYDGTAMRLFLNGVEVGNLTVSGAVDAGNGVELGSVGEPLDGALDEAAIYGKALSPAELQQHYQNGLRGLGYSGEGPGDACEVILDGIHYPIQIISNSTVSGLRFNQTEMRIGFTLTGESGNNGYCNATIPKSLLKGIPWMIRIDDAIVDFNEETNDTHTFLYFTFMQGSALKVTIEGTWIVPEFSPLPPIILVTLSLVNVALTKLRRKLRKLLLRS